MSACLQTLGDALCAMRYALSSSSTCFGLTDRHTVEEGMESAFGFGTEGTGSICSPRERALIGQEDRILSPCHPLKRSLRALISRATFSHSFSQTSTIPKCKKSEKITHRESSRVPELGYVLKYEE